MKNIRLSSFEIYLLQESLKHYSALISKEEFPKNSIVTKEYDEMMIMQVEEKLAKATPKEKRLNVPA
jgi:hypothetical protein